MRSPAPPLRSVEYSRADRVFKAQQKHFSPVHNGPGFVLASGLHIHMYNTKCAAATDDRQCVQVAGLNPPVRCTNWGVSLSDPEDNLCPGPGNGPTAKDCTEDGFIFFFLKINYARLAVFSDDIPWLSNNTNALPPFDACRFPHPTRRALEREDRSLWHVGWKIRCLPHPLPPVPKDFLARPRNEADLSYELRSQN